MSSESGHTANSRQNATTIHHRHSPVVRHYHLKRNDRGGVLVTKEQIQNLFNFIGNNGAENIQNNNSIETLTLQQVQDNLTTFFPNMTSKDFKVLMGGSKQITIGEMEQLLLNNDLVNFDPSIESFHALDPSEAGCVNPERIKEIFVKLGYGGLSEEEMKILTTVSSICRCFSV
jgi:Ca2+-binding EF-hand superfamily protein